MLYESGCTSTYDLNQEVGPWCLGAAYSCFAPGFEPSQDPSSAPSFVPSSQAIYYKESKGKCETKK
jgi:hypothetical protein